MLSHCQPTQWRPSTENILKVVVASDMLDEQDASAVHLQGELSSHNGAEEEGRPQQLVHGKPDQSPCTPHPLCVVLRVMTSHYM